MAKLLWSKKHRWRSRQGKGQQATMSPAMPWFYITSYIKSTWKNNNILCFCTPLVFNNHVGNDVVHSLVTILHPTSESWRIRAFCKRIVVCIASPKMKGLRLNRLMYGFTMVHVEYISWPSVMINPSINSNIQNSHSNPPIATRHTSLPPATDLSESSFKAKRFGTSQLLPCKLCHFHHFNRF